MGFDECVGSETGTWTANSVKLLENLGNCSSQAFAFTRKAFFSCGLIGLCFWLRWRAAAYDSNETEIPKNFPASLSDEQGLSANFV